MSKLNPIERSEYIKKRFQKYLKSTFKFSNDDLQRQFNGKLEEQELFNGPFVDLVLPFQRGKSLSELIDEGVINKDFGQLNSLNLDRPLYLHQEESIRNIKNGHNTIVTTGTGSGKTECFLLPIINSILDDIQNGEKGMGIKSMFLYPMNALVNDQMDRLRDMVKDYPEITFGFFTGDTPEKKTASVIQKFQEENNTDIPVNELISREEIRNTPPDLLFTNYSMLEYLMIRPKDSELFTPDHLKGWKYIVLDEAHTYRGSLGIEISMLLKRVTGLSDHKLHFILTSATLGEQGKSEQAIIDFAKNLTSSQYNVSDIIFSKRIGLNINKVKYQVAGEDYTDLKNNIHNYEVVKQICNKYYDCHETTISNCLYELLVADETVYKLYELLKSECKDFYYLSHMLCKYVNEMQLIHLIDLINCSENRDHIELFSLKYHFFIRPLYGAYVTLRDTPKLSLTKTNYIDQYRAFEIGNCRYCGNSFLIGKIIKNQNDGLDYLAQNDYVDVYENYGEKEEIKLDYFSFSNKIDDEEENQSLTKYALCGKCGHIYMADNLNAVKCDCGDEYITYVYKVEEKDNKKGKNAHNNITQCPCCGNKSQAGVVKVLNMGKDEGTALVSQILYEAIDEKDEETYKPKKLSLKPKAHNEAHNNNPKVKQFLSFSDSRQEASFATVFMNSSYTRMLRKRLIWKMLEDQNYEDVRIDTLAAYLSDYIKKNKLFGNQLTFHKQAWLTLMIDLLKVDGNYDGEGLGLYYFDLDLSEVDESFDEDDVREEFGELNIDKNDLLTLMKIVFNVFKTTPAINYVKSELTPEEKKEYLDYRKFDNFIEYQSTSRKKNVKSFMPLKGKYNNVFRYVEKVCNGNAEAAENILDVIFNSIAVELSNMNTNEPLFIKNGKEAQYQINVSKYIVKNYKKHKYYQCTKCGRLTPYNVHNICTHDGCNGTLIEVDPDVAFADNFYREQYKNMKIENIVIEEHTAQLNKDKARQYQNDFKNQKINILSCSTTFEMGVDLGSLETVFMRNVPPTPANYVQRAGRAGRRKDSSAYILTYCGVKSHDYTYFKQPQKMISGIIEPPKFNINNKKIIKRHLMSASLGFFFRKYPEYYKSLDEFIFHDGVTEFYNYMAEKPEDLRNYIDNKVLDENTYNEYKNFGWLNEFNGTDEKLDYMVETVKNINKEYDEAKEDALKNEDYISMSRFQNYEEALKKEKVLNALSNYCVIPKYGFPVDVVGLEVYENGVLNNTLNLTRDLKMAIAEYAPDSEVIVDKKKYTSKYITLSKTKEMVRNYYKECPICHKMNTSYNKNALYTCKYCHSDLNNTVDVPYFIEPIHGFKTGYTKESTRLKPKRSYAGNIYYLGGGSDDLKPKNIKDVIVLESKKDDELLIMNQSDFYMCPVCGYGEINNPKMYVPSIQKEHVNCRGHNCSNEVLEKVSLGHKFTTDVLRIKMTLLTSNDYEQKARALSVLYALLEGMSQALNIERRDIDGVIDFNLNTNSYDLILYDNVPGGAGHVKRLLEDEALISVLHSALDKVSQGCCDENTSCYNCLRNYYNQSYHDLLKRKLAKEVITELLRIIE